jgi:hypothetical protein
MSTLPAGHQRCAIKNYDLRLRNTRRKMQHAKEGTVLALGEEGTREGEEAEDRSPEEAPRMGVCGALKSREPRWVSPAVGLQISSDGGEPTCGHTAYLQTQLPDVLPPLLITLWKRQRTMDAEQRSTTSMRWPSDRRMNGPMPGGMGMPAGSCVVSWPSICLCGSKRWVTRICTHAPQKFTTGT